MKIAGIISEYNPFHSGHALHIAETKRILGEGGGVVCVMSGNFVQRGEPAVFRKHARAKAAVMSGADLVLENPAPWALSSAERFAEGGTALLAALGICTHISFGSENGDIETLLNCAETASSEEGRELTALALKNGASYASARSRAMKALGADDEVFNSPNDTLAVEYLRAVKKLGAPLTPIAVKRQGAGHDEQVRDVTASGAYLRKALYAGEDISGLVPEAALEIYRDELCTGRGPISWESMENSVMARLRGMTENDFAALPDATEGLDKRMYRAAKTEPDIQSFLFAVKTKRYVLSRIRRMLTAAYLGIRAEDAAGCPPYARVLAANGAGITMLREIGRKGSIPVLTKPAEAKELDERARRIFEIEAYGTDLYTLAYPNASERRGGQEWRISPVITDKGE
ncbi:MAG: nucleotidyltransferase family protein [Oscillospiraceae bacterium]|nr:nucleotidyltransferase family protein [Oscillospiraceae bacterium]